MSIQTLADCLGTWVYVQDGKPNKYYMVVPAQATQYRIEWWRDGDKPDEIRGITVSTKEAFRRVYEKYLGGFQLENPYTGFPTPDAKACTFALAGITARKREASPLSEFLAFLTPKKQK